MALACAELVDGLGFGSSRQDKALIVRQKTASTYRASAKVRPFHSKGRNNEQRQTDQRRLLRSAGLQGEKTG